METIINEYIVRAITLRLFELKQKNSFMKYLTKNNSQKGFIKIVEGKDYIGRNIEVNVMPLRPGKK